MKFFTPKLYLQFNSDNPDEADKADRQWEKAIKQYRKHLHDIDSRLSASVRELAHSLCLHDADYLGLVLPQIPHRDASLAVVMLRQEATDLFLVYLLTEEPLIQPVKERWPFSTEQAHWLYDEFSVDDAGTPQHEILLSNGRILTLKFREMELLRHQFSERPALAQS